MFVLQSVQRGLAAIVSILSTDEKGYKKWLETDCFAKIMVTT